ncbi:MAG TPA: hypothetical protein VJ642_05810 [Chromobacteriaceae bacterium]|nr:hypothetical protein [Chromobacteriaceae bacterium]
MQKTVHDKKSIIYFANNYFSKTFVNPFRETTVFSGFFYICLTIFISLFTYYFFITSNEERTPVLIATIFFEILALAILEKMKSDEKKNVMHKWRIHLAEGTTFEIGRIEFLNSLINKNQVDSLITNYETLLKWKSQLNREQRVLDFISSRDARPRIISLTIYFISLCALIVKTDRSVNDLFSAFPNLWSYLITITFSWLLISLIFLLGLILIETITSLLRKIIAAKQVKSMLFNKYAIESIINDLVQISATMKSHPAIK